MGSGAAPAIEKHAHLDGTVAIAAIWPLSGNATALRALPFANWYICSQAASQCHKTHCQAFAEQAESRYLSLICN